MPFKQKRVTSPCMIPCGGEVWVFCAELSRCCWWVLLPINLREYMYLPYKTTLTKNSAAWMDPWIKGSNNVGCHLPSFHLPFARNGFENMPRRYSSIVLIRGFDPYQESISNRSNDQPPRIATRVRTGFPCFSRRWKRCASWFPGLQLFCVCDDIGKKKWTTPRPWAFPKITNTSLMISRASILYSESPLWRLLY